MIVFSVVGVLLLAGVIALIPLGLRAGDRPGDVSLLGVAPRAAPRGATVTVTNPGHEPAIIGMSLRPAGARLRLEGDAYVRIRTGRTTDELLAGRQTRLGVLDAGETQTFAVPAATDIRRRGELMAVIGQPGRLRTIHRLVVLPQFDLAPRSPRLPVRS